MNNLPRKDRPEREVIDVEVGDFSHDRLYPDLNPELFEEQKLMTEDEYYNNLAEEEAAYHAYEDEQFQIEQTLRDSGDLFFE